MGSTWRKAKRALGLNLCVYIPGDDDVEPGGSLRGSLRSGTSAASRRVSDAASDPPAFAASPTGSVSSIEYRVLMPTTPIPTSGGLRLSKSGSRSSKKTCAICLGAMKAGHGHALFTAECSHTFHFNCITSNVKFGNIICPVCRAKWKEIPFQGRLASELPHGRARVNPINLPQDDGHMTVLRRPPRSNSTRQQHQFTSYFHASEPSTFDDDEPVDMLSEMAVGFQHGCAHTAEIQTYPEFAAVPQSGFLDNFSVLIHLKAPHNSMMKHSPSSNLSGSSAAPQNSRAPIDLVTVLDISGSMAGTKLALLKRAMGFVIQNLGPSDRLSVIAFSSTARRLFHLRRMSEAGRQQALQAVNSLVSSGGTNIAEGLRKGARVIEERKLKNSVCSIILLSDGQDTYTLPSNVNGNQRSPPDYKLLVPFSIHMSATHQFPVHTFGFGSDHDSAAMHAISELSGGTFSFIESEVVIQDAFAQCIGGLLSVVVQEMRVSVESVHHAVRISTIKSGSYTNRVSDNARTGSINVGNLYADEERDFLISINVPPAVKDTVLLKVGCAYTDPVSKESVTLDSKEVRIQRPEFVSTLSPSIEVDRERNRVQVAEAISEAKTAADRDALSEAVTVLEECRKKLLESLAARSGDRLCMSLDAELREMQERMANRQTYEVSGRAYVLSGLSSHSWQRATARGDSTDSTTLLHAYQTPSMTDMLQRSQTFYPASRGPTPPIAPSRSMPARRNPR